MPSKEVRREAIRDFKERKPLVGIYSIRCTVSGRVWVGASRNLEATKNRCWFSLRIGSHQEQTLQREWNANGEAAFQYEILNCIDQETHPLEVADLLKKKLSDSVAQLNAQQLL
jgi:hypothetical protein